METRQQVIDLLDKLATTDWFISVGITLDVVKIDGMTLSRVESWDAARRVIESDETEEFLTGSQNHLYREHEQALKGKLPAKVYVTEFNNWIDGTRQQIEHVASIACRSALIPTEIGKTYYSTLSWMIQKACVIYQFDEYIKENRLYVSVIDLLKKGHCVCGWSGEFPQGNLVVY
jgi:hypothetical protein